MRVAVFIKRTTHHKNFGGLETQNKLLCEGLAKRGYQITVFSPRRELQIDSASENGVIYHFIECRDNFSIFEGLNPHNWFSRSYEVFTKTNKEKRYDLVISQSSAALGIIRKREEFYIPIVSICHGTIVSEYKTALSPLSLKALLKLIPNTLYTIRIFFGRQREFVHGSNLVIAVSTYVKQALIDETFIEDNKVLVINNGVDPNPFVGYVRQRKPSEKVKIAYVGRVIRAKGVFSLLKAMNTLDNSLLNIYGEGEDLQALKLQVKRQKLGEKVIVHGQLSYNQIIPKLFDNDIFVLPSKRLEGFPMTLIEAMFAGLPVVASNIGGIPDAIDNLKTGFLIESTSEEDLLAKLQTLVQDSKLREKMGILGKTKAYQEFSLDVMLNKYEKIFNLLVLRTSN